MLCAFFVYSANFLQAISNVRYKCDIISSVKILDDLILNYYQYLFMILSPIKKPTVKINAMINTPINKIAAIMRKAYHQEKEEPKTKLLTVK